jgi:putative glycerol-1-phosphate prenyltransferase
MQDGMPKIYSSLIQSRKDQSGKFIVLFDPDKLRLKKMEEIIHTSVEAGVDYFFIGGSLVVNDMLDQVLTDIKKSCEIPMILFPGNSFQLSWRADAILFLSLISGRNADLLIGKHVITAPFLKLSPLEIISTGYMLIDGGVQTSVSYMSNTSPIPADKNDIALCTAIAGELLGLKMIYMDAGSGAKAPVSLDMIETVSNGINIPLLVGGGIKKPERAAATIAAGADAIVVGTAIENNPGLIREMAEAIHQQKKVIKNA